MLSKNEIKGPHGLKVIYWWRISMTHHKNLVKFIEQVDKHIGKRHLAVMACFDFQITFCKVFNQSLLKKLGCLNEKKHFHMDKDFVTYRKYGESSQFLKQRIISHVALHWYLCCFIWPQINQKRRWNEGGSQVTATNKFLKERNFMVCSKVGLHNTE